MKIADIKIGHVYAMRVGHRFAPVRIEGEFKSLAVVIRDGRMFNAPRRMRKFYGTNMTTGRNIRSISPARVRCEVITKDGVWRRLLKETA